MNTPILQVALDTPLDVVFDYLLDANAETVPAPGDLVRVPFGAREVTGLVVAQIAHSSVPAEKLRHALSLPSPRLAQDWLDLCQFAADYYQRPYGEVALPALPKKLREINLKASEKLDKKLTKLKTCNDALESAPAQLNPAQAEALAQIAQSKGFAPFLLHGVTGSGKTETYLQAAAKVLQASASAQILILVPEINLTPQVEAHIRLRFSGLQIATLHSGLAEGERLLHWMMAHTGQARIILGTRLAVMASLPDLKLIIVDEEHDMSYKQQDGLRYSARDLAVWRAHQLQIPIVLGSATPSLESWYGAQQGRYRLLQLSERAVQDAVLPIIKLVDLSREKASQGLSPRLLSAIQSRLDKGEQSLLYLNRRGYAPVLACDACGWTSACQRCSAHLVLHLQDRRLHCHHCGLEQFIPRACPTCGNVDLQPLGRGTQRLEESLAKLFPQARVFRIDADSTRKKGSAQAAFERVHEGAVDILIGTQMVAKGHDFKRLTLVAALNPDSALFSQDVRASERLFAQLMQVAGRAGRAAQTEQGNPAEVLIQTRYPDHPLYHALARHDYPGFATSLLAERQSAHMPPYMYQALLRAEARELAQAMEFLQQAAQCLPVDGIQINDPIPMHMMRIANRERAQLLVESASRPALQAYLKAWLSELKGIRTRVKWMLEVDPVEI